MIIQLLIPFVLTSQSNPFNSLEHNRVVAYEYQGEGGLQIEACLKNEKEKISNTIELTEAQVEELEVILTSDTSYGTTTASCFDPHFAIVYYSGNKILASVSICLDCNYLMSSLDIPATTKESIKVNDDYSYPAKGFSPTARKGIHGFCKQIGFETYLEPLGSIYDE
jgi:hypothetical protein